MSLAANFTDLSLREKIGQLIVVRTTGYLFDHQIRYPAWEANQTQLKKWLQEFNLGGVILLGGSCAEIAYRTQQLQSWAKTPLLVCADIEEGVGQRFSGATWFPPPMALSAIAKSNLSVAQTYAQKMGKVTAQEALAIGINWILAPVADVNNNPLNPVINVRSFGNNPEVVSALATSFIQGCQSLPILTTAKHFPGHGDTATDSHLELPHLAHQLERLQEIELLPFQECIDQGVDSIMSAHLLVEALDPQYPATLSSPILTQLLREEMGFDGLIVTDALIMGGVSKFASPQEIAVKAIQAGADILLMPDNPEVAINSIEEAIADGTITEARIDRSLERIYHAKNKLFTSAESIEPLDLEVISTSESHQTVQEILNQSRQTGGNFPLKQVSGGINLVMVDDLLNCDFLDRQTAAITKPESKGYHTQIVETKNLHLASYQGESIFLQAFIRGNPFRGNAGFSSTMKQYYRQLIEQNQLEGVIIYGSPYVLDWFVTMIPPQTPWVFSYGQMPSAQKNACETLFTPIEEDSLLRGNFL